AAAQLGLLGLIAAGLVAWHRVLPFEVVGVVATGPVAAWALWRADPPRSWQAAAGASWPYLLLTACLLAARAVPGAPALRPFEGLPGFGLTHVAAVLWAVSLALLAARGEALHRASAALGRARRPAAAMLLYVVLGRWLAGSGIAAALAGGLVAGKGTLAAFALVPMGFLSGFVTGSNVGANAALMPVQAALGEALGWGPLVAPALHNFSGAAGAGMAIAGTAMLCALQGEGTRPGQVWRLLWPSMALVVTIGTGAMLAWR
ncbi:MAG TPA: L-lactate permease, partial [Roseococcus sp.]|nr:L-lactate permease [Roseococcus sp.]